MKPTAKKTAAAAPPAPAPDVPQNVPQPADPLGLIPGVNDDPNVPPPDDAPTVIIPPDDDDDHIPGLDLPPSPDTGAPGAADPTPPPGVVTTKDGRARTVIRTEAPPPPPEPRAGRAPRKSDLAAAYYGRLNPGSNFSALSINDQALWYERAVNAGGSI